MPRKVAEHVKAAVERAEARSAGVDPFAEPAPKAKRTRKTKKADAPSPDVVKEAIEAIVDDLTVEAFEIEAHTIRRGRPTKYKPEFAAQAEKLCKLGATDAELADFFEVDVRTIPRWSAEHDEFCQSLKVGKDAADARVERSLFQRAVGFEMDAVKITSPQSGTPKVIRYRESIAPDTTACIFWLKNRKRTEWRDKQELEHQAGDGFREVWAAISTRAVA